MVKILTMVKDEDDIVKEWVLYHGSIFGFENLYIIDNFSTDKTYNILLELKKKYNIQIFRFNNYLLKGQYMTYLLNKFCKDHKFCFPIDIDEFIVYYNKNNNKINCDKNIILSYIRNILPNYSNGVYKMNYINPVLLNNYGYSNAPIQQIKGKYDDYKNLAKSFFHTKLFSGMIDHGNHYKTENYYKSNLCLVHYHYRNIEQIKKKIYNNIIGLNYSCNLENLKKIIKEKPSCPGNHHVNNFIKILENTFTLNVENEENLDESCIDLTPIIEKLKKLLFT